MTYFFVGGEDSDFANVGGGSVDTGNSFRRAANARCALKVAASSFGNGWRAVLPAGVSEFWTSAWVHNVDYGQYQPGESIWFALMDASGVPRLQIKPSYMGGTYMSAAKPVLYKANAAQATTTLATANVNFPLGALAKLDVYVKYAVAGRITVYLGGAIIMDYIGDVTTDSATALQQIQFGSIIANTNAPTYWSEVIVADQDTRGLSLVTLPPAAAGNVFQWTGSAANINELVTDDSTLISSDTAGQVAETTIATTLLTGNPGIGALIVKARATRGATGPQNADLMVRTGGVDYVSSDLALPSSLGNISNVWATNPATGKSWTVADLSAAGFNIGIKSIA